MFHVFHTWSRWENYEQIVFNADLFKLLAQRGVSSNDAKLYSTYSITMQKRVCSVCNKVEIIEINRAD